MGDGRPALDLTLLGPVSVEHGGCSLGLGGPKQRAVLALLALNAGHLVTTDRLVRGVWNEETTTSTTAALRTYVSNLRRALRAAEPDPTTAGKETDVADQMLATRSPGYVLDVSPVRIDAFRFRTKVAEARTMTAAAAADALEAALGLWRGPALADLRHLPGVDRVGTALDQERVLATEEWIDRGLELGRHRELLGVLEREVEQHPLQERLWMQLALAHYRCGQQTAALRACSTLRETLRRDIGIDPGRELGDLELAILEQRPDLDVPPAPMGSGARPPAPVIESPAKRTDRRSSAFVGREPELAALHQARTRGGGLRAALVVGPAGIGKTALLRQLGSDATAAGSVALHGSMDPDQVLPFRAFLSIADQARALTGGDAPTIVSTSDQPSGVESARTRVQLFQDTLDAISRTTTAGPTVVLLDDLQWCDQQSRAMIRFLRQEGADLDVTLIATVRDERPADVDAIVVLLEPQAHVDLRGLGPTELRQLIDLSTDVSDSRGAALAESLHEVTDGNPFYARELLRLVPERQLREHHDPTELFDSLGLPHGVRHVVEQRLDDLDPETTELLKVASAVGATFDVALVAAIAGVDADVALACLDRAATVGLLTEVATELDHFAFSHALTRRYVYQALSLSRRTRVHQLAADELAAIGAPESVRFHHVLQARPRTERADVAGTGLRAVDQLLGSGAMERAVDIADRSLDVLAADVADVADDELRSRLWTGRGRALVGLGEADDARASFTEGQRLARLAGAFEAFTDATLGPKELSHDTGPDRSAVASLEDALAFARHEPDCHARVAAGLAIEQVYVGDVDGATAVLDDAERSIGPTGHRRARLALDIARLGVMMLELPDDRDVVATARRTECLATEVGDERAALQALTHGLAALLALGELEPFASRLDELEDRAAATRDHAHRWFALAMRSTLAFVRGDIDTAEKRNDEALTFGLQYGLQVTMPAYSSQLYVIRAAQGRLDELIPLVRPLVERQPDVPVWRLGLGTCLAQVGDLDGARACLAPSTAVGFEDIGPDVLRISQLAIASQLAAQTDDAAAAELLLAQLRPYEDRIVVGGLAASCIGPVTRYLTVLAATVGDDRHETHYRAAAARTSARTGIVAWAAADGLPIRARDTPDRS